MEKSRFLFSDIFWVLLALIGIFAANFFNDNIYVKYFQGFCGGVFLFFWAKGLYAAFNRKDD